MLIPKSTTFEMMCAMRQIILRPPGAPTVRKGCPSLSTKTGVMLFRPRLNPAIEFAVPGMGLKMTIPLVSSTPVPGTMTLEPNAPTAVWVHATMFRSLSMMLKWVVQSPSLGGDAGDARSGRGCGS